MLLLCGRGDPRDDPAHGPAAGCGRRGHPRDPALPPEEPPPRAAPRHRAAGVGAAQQADRARRAGARLHLVVGLRHRADADPARALRRPGRLHAGRSHHAGHPRRPLLRDPVVPRRDRPLHEGRRLLRRGPGQLRPADRADRCRRVAHRLHGDRGGADVRRHRGPHQRRAQPGQPLGHGGDHGRRDPAPPLRQPARHPRGGELLRHPDLLLRLRAGLGDHRGRGQGGGRAPASDAAAARERALRRQDRHARLGVADGAGLHFAAALLRQRRLVADGSRGDLQRREQLPQARVAQRTPDAWWR